MAGGTYFNMQWFAQRRTRRESIPATAGHRDIGVLRMNFRFHVVSFLVEAGFALPEGADYPQESCGWQPRVSVVGWLADSKLGIPLPVFKAFIAGMDSAPPEASPARYPRRIESKKSALFLVPRSLSTRNSVAPSSSMGSRADPLPVNRPFAGSARFIPSSAIRVASSQRNRRCSWYRAAYRRGIRSLPTRPWGKAVFAAPRSSAARLSRSAALRGGCPSGSR